MGDLRMQYRYIYFKESEAKLRLCCISKPVLWPCVRDLAWDERLVAVSA